MQRRAVLCSRENALNEPMLPWQRGEAGKINKAANECWKWAVSEIILLVDPQSPVLTPVLLFVKASMPADSP